MQFGVYTFIETRRDPATGEPVDVDKDFADVIEQIELADPVGLDVFGVGEHHRPDFALPAPSWQPRYGPSRRDEGPHPRHSDKVRRARPEALVRH